MIKFVNYMHSITHNKELNDQRCSLLKSHNAKILEIQEKFREEQLEKMKLEVKTTEAVNVMEVAVGKAATACHK